MKTANLSTREQVEQYAAIVWDSEDLIEIRPLPANLGKRVWIRAADIGKHVERMERENGAGANIYAGVLPRSRHGGGTDEDVVGGWVVWADLDGTDPREAWRVVERKGLPSPNLVVNSGHGCHLLWRFTERQDPRELTDLSSNVADILGSDRSVANPSRILRLPGFWNHKEPPALCVLLYANAGRQYDFGEFAQLVLEAVPSDPEPERSEPPRLSASPSGEVERARKYLARIENRGEGDRNNAAFRIACLLTRDFALSEADAWTLLCQWNAGNHPPLEERELREVFKSAMKHAKHAVGEKAKPEPPIPARPKAEADDLADMRQELQEQARSKGVILPWSRLQSSAHPLRAGSVSLLAGPPATGKSFFALNVVKAIHDAGATWRYLPLEDRRVDLKFRLLALLAHNYAMIDETPHGVDARQKAIERYGPELRAMVENVCENPRMGDRDARGKTVVPPLPYGRVLDWLSRAFESCRFVIADPASQIEFPGRDSWRHEADFIRQALALAADARGTLLLVAHTSKRPGKSASLPLSLEDVQGAAAFTRLSHCCLLLDAHEDREAEVYRRGGLRETVTHNRTVTIAKARNASGSRQRIAFVQDSDGPSFEEMGVIATGKGKPKRTKPVERTPYKDSEVDY